MQVSIELQQQYPRSADVDFNMYLNVSVADLNMHTSVYLFTL